MTCIECEDDGTCIKCNDDLVLNEDKTACVKPPTKCHPSCNCESTETKCAECNICTTCKQPGMTQMIGKDYC